MTGFQAHDVCTPFRYSIDLWQRWMTRIIELTSGMGVAGVYERPSPQAAPNREPSRT